MPPTTVVSERRRDLRKRPISLIYVELPASNGGMMRDLSEMGFAMRAMLPLRAGEITSFAFSLTPTVRLEGKCRVLWVDEDGKLAGMHFTEVPFDLPVKIRNWIGELDNSNAAAESSAQAEASRVRTVEELKEELRTVPARPEFEEVEANPSPGPGSAAIPASPPAPVPAPVAPAAVRMPPAFTVPEAPPSPPAPAPKDEIDGSTPPPPRRSPFVRTETVPAAPSTPSAYTAPAQPVAPAAPVQAFAAPALAEAFTLPVERVPPLPELPYDSPPPKVRIDSSMVSLAVRILLLLALLAVAAVYRRPVGNAIIWFGTKVAGGAPAAPVSSNSAVGLPSASAAPDPLPASPPAVPEGLSNTEPVAQSESRPEVSSPVESRPTGTLKGSSAAATPPALPVAHTTPPPSTTIPGVEPGQLEYLAAQDLLNRNDSATLPEAVRLLWASVEKGNPNAEVALAELYHQGRGVKRSCEQTEILLKAAVRKGNSTARNLLEQFQKESCE